MFLEKNSDIKGFSQFSSFKTTETPTNNVTKVRWMLVIFIIVLLALFLPWTQSVALKGGVSSLDPEQRPQEVNSVIAGRITKWYIQSGKIVKKGDTLLQLSEVKDEYLDPELVERTTEQLDAKNSAAQFYRGKVGTTEQQISAMKESLGLKVAQLKNKLKQYTLQIQSDSIAMNASNGQFEIAKVQLDRQKELYKGGLKSLTDLEKSQQYFQDALSKKTSSENKFYNGKNELLNIKLELSASAQDYAEKISKITGEKFAALSQAAAGEGEASKLKNTLFNYRARQAFHYITAPQNGQVLQRERAGIGEVVKDGEPLLTIIPTQIRKAIEIGVSANDMPLISKGQMVSIQFDGFPAIIFSGWPEASYGLFNGRVAAIDNAIDQSGKFKVWIVPEEKEKPWPAQVRYGTGCQVIALLNNVPIWYELWRQFNGFPPDFYQQKPLAEKGKK